MENSRSRWRHHMRPVELLLKTKGVQKALAFGGLSVCQWPPLLHIFGGCDERWNTIQAGRETDGWREVESC